MKLSVYVLPVAVARSSSDNGAIGYVLPVLSMSSRFHMMEPMDQNQRRRHVSSGSLDVEVALYDGRLVLSATEFRRRIRAIRNKSRTFATNTLYTQSHVGVIVGVRGVRTPTFWSGKTDPPAL